MQALNTHVQIDRKHRLKFFIFSKEKKMNLTKIDSESWRVHEMLRWQFNESWTSCLPPNPGQPETTLLSQKEAPFFVCRPDSLRLEEVILLAMFTEIIHFS